MCKTQPWAAGPVGLQQLALLQGFDLDDLSTAELVHVLVECGKLAFADRDALYGDSEDVPLETLLSAEYNDRRRSPACHADSLPRGGDRPARERQP